MIAIVNGHGMMGNNVVSSEQCRYKCEPAAVQDCCAGQVLGVLN